MPLTHRDNGVSMGGSLKEVYSKKMLHFGGPIMPMLTANALSFFLSPKLSYVLFILARDHLGKLGFAGDGKISFEICSTQFPTYFFSKWVTVKIGIKFKPHLFRLCLDRV